MTRRARHTIMLLLWLAGFLFLGFGVWGFQGGELMILVYLAMGVIAYGVYAFAARCPKCGMPVLLRPRRIFGAEIFTWSLLTPERCRHCGAAL